MLQPGRKYTNESGYRFGFNGKENDNEVKGEGNQQDYGMRIYDSRVGRFLSVDPLTKNYPGLTPYQYASNNPIQNIDIDGLEGGAANGAKTNTESPSGPWNLGFLKAEKETYKNSSWFGTPGAKLKIPIFAKNVVTSGYNQAITSVEDLPTNFHIITNVFTSKGRKENVGIGFNMLSQAVSWWQDEPYKNVNTFEDLGGMLLLGKAFSANNPFARGNSYIALVIKDKVRINVNAEYAKAIGGKAGYMESTEGNGRGFITLSENSRIQLIEEAIHYKQWKENGSKYFNENRNLLEYEAQLELIKIGKAEGWSKSEMAELSSAAKSWGKKCIEEIDAKIAALDEK